MKILLALLIIAIGSLGQSSSYVPINKVHNWSWECFWLIQGCFAWLLFPWLGAMLSLPEGMTLCDLYFSLPFEGRAGDGSGLSILYGALWGIGGLTFGLSMRYLGVALGQSIALGTCSAFGTLLPALFAGTDLLHGEGLILLLGVCITLAGITIIGFAGSLRTKGLSEEEQRAAIKDFALTKGLLVALLAGVMSACFALGLDAGQGVRETMTAAGANSLLAGLPVILLVTFGGFLTNAAYCLYQNAKNHTFSQYIQISLRDKINNVLFCALAGLLWYSQFFGLEIGKSLLTDSPVLLAFSWCILMSLNILFSNMWGLILHEWKGAKPLTLVVLIAGLVVLLFSVFFPSLV